MFSSRDGVSQQCSGSSDQPQQYSDSLVGLTILGMDLRPFRAHTFQPESWALAQAVRLRVTFAKSEPTPVSLVQLISTSFPRGKYFLIYKLIEAKFVSFRLRESLRPIFSAPLTSTGCPTCLHHTPSPSLTRPARPALHRCAATCSSAPRCCPTPTPAAHPAVARSAEPRNKRIEGDGEQERVKVG